MTVEPGSVPSLLTPLRDPPAARRRSGRYLSVQVKFTIALAWSVLWMAGSVWLSLPWLRDLADLTHPVIAVLVITLVAYLPGGVVAFLAASLVLDRQPSLRVTSPTTPVTVVIAARNEVAGIGTTLRYLANQDYAGPVTVVLADNGSADGTAEVAAQAAQDLGVRLVVVDAPVPGKSHALNAALDRVTTGLVVTLDADTLLHPSALRSLVARLESAPDDVVAVAGSILVRNSRDGFWARMQEWDYFLGIASVKRMQGLYQGTLVAQGAFSLYRADAVRAVGGWPDAIGEDIVITWHLLAQRGRVYFEPLAVAFTDVPVSLRHLARQRARWARGMLEGLRAVPPWRQHTPMTRLMTGLDLVIPALDLGYTLIWMPGLVLALAGYYWVVGPWTLFVLPLTLLVNVILYRFQRRHVFGRLGLRVRRNAVGFVAYVVVYQMVMSPVAVYGYLQELVGSRRRWK
ncbi:glycosyltransferase family 2 protein [Kineosporiaceae bacterium SCSIO 59966]|nr:glycosyltransferase family 2 protein [Kineosporiaceae bacterium SCSIO 59966]